MTDWLTWLLRAWAAVVMLVSVATVVDRHESDRHDGRPEAGQTLPDREPGVTTTVGTSRGFDIEEDVATRPVSMPVTVEAPAVDIAADLVSVSKTADGALAVPDFGLAGWYEHSVRPGEAGAAVLAGHVDSTTGPDVFYTLGQLAAGDEVVVRGADGVATTFVVDHVEVTDKDELPVERIFGHTDDAELRLITCGGVFDRSIRSYESNVIVYATAASSAELAAS